MAAGNAFDPRELDETGLLQHLSELVEAIEACGLVRDATAQHPTWLREVPADGEADSHDDADLDKVVLWRHPRMLDTLQGYVATTRVPHMVHLRLFDPTWQPATLLPGHFDKGWRFDSAEALRAIASDLRERLWPRALSWFEEPIEPEALMLAHGRRPALLAPGPLLERHRERAQWLEAQGQTREAAWLRGVIAGIERLYEPPPE